MRRETRALIFAGTAVLFWSTAASAFKLTLRELAPLQMLFWSSLASFLFLSVVCMVSGRLKRESIFDANVILQAALLGGLNPFLYYLILFRAYDCLAAQEALVLNYTWPIALAVLSVPILKQRLGLKSIAALGICFAGVIIIATGGDVASFSVGNPVGVTLALSSAVVWALYWLFSVRGNIDAVTGLMLNFFFGTLYIAVAAFLADGVVMPGIAGFAGAVYIGLFEMGLTFVLWRRGLSLAASSVDVGVLVYASPFISLGLIQRLVGERIAAATILGLVIIIAGILLQQYGRKKGG